MDVIRRTFGYDPIDRSLMGRQQRLELRASLTGSWVTDIAVCSGAFAASGLVVIDKHDTERHGLE